MTWLVEYEAYTLRKSQLKRGHIARLVCVLDIMIANGMFAYIACITYRRQDLGSLGAPHSKGTYQHIQ